MVCVCACWCESALTRRREKKGNAPEATAGGGTRASSQQPGAMPARASDHSSLRCPAESAAAAAIAAGKGRSAPPAAARNKCTCVASTPQLGNLSHALATTSATSVQPASCTLAKASPSSGDSLTRMMKAHCASGKGSGSEGARARRAHTKEAAAARGECVC